MKTTMQRTVKRTMEVEMGIFRRWRSRWWTMESWRLRLRSKMARKTVVVRATRTMKRTMEVMKAMLPHCWPQTLPKLVVVVGILAPSIRIMAHVVVGHTADSIIRQEPGLVAAFRLLTGAAPSPSVATWISAIAAVEP